MRPPPTVFHHSAAPSPSKWCNKSARYNILYITICVSYKRITYKLLHVFHLLHWMYNVTYLIYYLFICKDKINVIQTVIYNKIWCSIEWLSVEVGSKYFYCLLICWYCVCLFFFFQILIGWNFAQKKLNSSKFACLDCVLKTAALLW